MPANNKAFLQGYLQKTAEDITQQPWYHGGIRTALPATEHTYRDWNRRHFDRAHSIGYDTDVRQWENYQPYLDKMTALGLTPDNVQQYLDAYNEADRGWNQTLDKAHEKEQTLLQQIQMLEQQRNSLPPNHPRRAALDQGIARTEGHLNSMWEKVRNTPQPNEAYQELAWEARFDPQKPDRPRPVPQYTHSPAWTPEHEKEFQRALPNSPISVEGRDPATQQDIDMQGPNYNWASQRLRMPAFGDRNMEIAMHEATHAFDPVLQYGGKELRAGRENPVVKNPGFQLEPEIPAMAVERAIESSPYLPPDRRRAFLSGYGRQIDAHGPHISGNLPRDLDSVKNWVQGLRSTPGAKVEQRRPFAYNRDKRTPEQRAQGLGKSYKNWANWNTRNYDTRMKNFDPEAAVRKQIGEIEKRFK